MLVLLLLHLLPRCESMLLLVLDLLWRWPLLWLCLHALYLRLRRLLLTVLLGWLLPSLVKEFGGHRNPTTAQLLSEPRVVPFLLRGGPGFHCRRVRPCASRLSSARPEGVQHVDVSVPIAAVTCSRRFSRRSRRRLSSFVATAGSVNALASRVASEHMSCFHGGARAWSRAGR
jgi:hypothetical protein